VNGLQFLLLAVLEEELPAAAAGKVKGGIIDEEIGFLRYEPG